MRDGIVLEFSERLEILQPMRGISTLLSVIACPIFTSADYPTGDVETDKQLVKDYRFAISDSLRRDESRIKSDLTAINFANEKLSWRDSTKKQLLVVTWYENFSDEDAKRRHAPRDLWVTAAPDLRAYYRDHRDEFQEPELRLKQLLGLDPRTKYRVLATFWVKPADLFRPSPDREITDSVANLDFDGDDKSKAASEHVAWCKKTQCEVVDRWPWTRLGYTYDWKNLQKPFGLSEFIVPNGAAIEHSKSYPEILRYLESP